MAVLGGPLAMGNVQPGTKLLLLCPDGTYKTYTVPSGVPMFSDLANDCQHSLIQVLP